MVIGDLDPLRSLIGPSETDPVLGNGARTQVYLEISIIPDALVVRFLGGVHLVLAPLPIHLFEQRPLLQLASELCSLGRIQLPEGEHKRLPVRRKELDASGLLPQLPLYG